MKFYMAITRGYGWELVRPTGGQPYEYDIQEEAQRMLAICYPDELRKARLGGPHTVAVLCLCKRFAITHLDEDGMRVLTFANQGRHHYDTREAADKALALIKDVNSRERIASVWGKRAFDTMEVREALCYTHGDAVGIYFDD